MDTLTQVVANALTSDTRFSVHQHGSLESFCEFVEKEKNYIDCLILHQTADLKHLTTWLYGRAILLPAVIVLDPAITDLTALSAPDPLSESFYYHMAEVAIPVENLPHIVPHLEQAITQFITLSPISWRKLNSTAPKAKNIPTAQDLLLPQQRRLTEKLKERLGYLGVYYKRDPQNFFRNLPTDQRQELFDMLKITYREIVLRYFSDDGTLNRRIDDFVNTAFFTDVSAAQIVEIHMQLIDEFSKQLKLEGRSEEILLDYRLTLIDTIAHLCEMYRRSIPRET